MKILKQLVGAIAQRRKSPYVASGVTGVHEYGGFVVTQEKNYKVSQREKYRTYSDMLANLSVVAAGVRYSNALISGAKWTFESEDQAMVDLANRVINDVEMPWRQVIKRAGMFRFYGFSFHEIVMERKMDGVILPRVIAPRAQNTIHQWDIDHGTGLLKGVVQRNPNNGQHVYLPRQKLFYVVDDSLNASPEGLGLFRHLVEPAQRLKDYQRLEWVGFETDLRGVLVLKVPYAALRQAVADQVITQEQMDQAVKSFKKFAENHVRGKETSTPNTCLLYTSPSPRD